MNSCEWHDHGYGVELNRLPFRAGSARRIVSMAIEHGILDLDDILCVLDIKTLDEATEEHLVRVIDEFNDHNGSAGLAGLLAELINDKMGGERRLESVGHCLYVPARIPKDEKARAAMLTQGQIQEILDRELNPLLVLPTAARFVEVCE